MEQAVREVEERCKTMKESRWKSDARVKRKKEVLEGRKEEPVAVHQNEEVGPQMGGKVLAPAALSGMAEVIVCSRRLCGGGCRETG